MEVDRRAFIASLGGPAVVAMMDHEAKAEALEHYMEDKLDEMVAAQQRRWEFLVTLAPLPIRGGTGSPINPIAVF